MKEPAFTLHSPETGTTYSLFVEEPTTPGPWPTFLLMDGDLLFSDRVGTENGGTENGGD